MLNLSEQVEVAENEELGPHLVASMDIAPGDMILEEPALLIAPHWDCEQMKCANCYRDSVVMCKKCEFFPLCLDCETHDAYECDFMIEHGEKLSKNLLVKNYEICAVLKLLLLLENPATHDHCEAIFSTNVNLDVDEYQKSEMSQEHEMDVVMPILQSGIGDLLENVNVDGDFLHNVCLHIDASAFEVTSKDGDSLKGIFVCAAKVPHSCVPNVLVSLDEDFNMKMYAAVPIKTGEIIYNTYANPLMGTTQRQHHLRMTRRIDCNCARCLDPTELGTNMSTMKCRSCTSGYAVCDLGKSGDWICTNCRASIQAFAVFKLLATVGEEMVRALADLVNYEKLLSKYAPLFHANHFLIIDIKQNIVTILRAIETGSLFEDPTISAKKVLERRVQLCKEMLPLTRAVLPGISKLYAIALYEYLVPFLELSGLQYEAKELEKDAYILKLKTAQEMAAEVAQMLAFEPANSPEGRLLKTINIEQIRIGDAIKQLNEK